MGLGFIRPGLAVEVGILQLLFSRYCANLEECTV